MAMHGIDISGYQNGINLDAVPHDFVIIKTTQGTYYVNDICDGWVQHEIAAGKPWGFYHYIGGGDATAEADFWVDNTENYWHHGLPCVDWEEIENSAWGDEGYLRTFVQRVIDRTGVKPLIYAQASAFPWQLAADLDCGSWVAQYATLDPTYGYEDSPWNEGAYSCTMRQYASACHLDGYGGNLDVDKFYGDVNAWNAYVQLNAPAQEEEQMALSEEDIETLAHRLWEYFYKDPKTGENTAINGNCYNELWLLAKTLTQPYDSPAGDNISGSLMDRVCYMDMRIREMYAQEAAQTEAIKALAEAKGADPDAIAQAVSDAVRKKLESLKLTVSE
ncbi:MAG: GH25 family lysozyme [Atopobiaceae bacterium]|nr:GH25 family lysozyme [Atopobiaceae bacterium]